MVSLNTSQGPPMSMTSAPSEITNATLIGPFAGGLRADACMVEEAASLAPGRPGSHRQRNPAPQSRPLQSRRTFFVLVMTVLLFNFHLAHGSRVRAEWNVSKDIRSGNPRHSGLSSGIICRANAYYSTIDVNSAMLRIVRQRYDSEARRHRRIRQHHVARPGWPSGSLQQSLI